MLGDKLLSRRDGGKLFRTVIRRI